MKKIIFFTLFVFLIIILYTIFNLYTLSKKSKTDLNKTLTCDLNVKDCTYDFKGKKVFVSLIPKPLQSFDVTHLEIKNLGNYPHLKFKIYGLTMFMGEIKPKLIQINQNDYKADIVLAACTLDTMRFRAEFMQDEKPIGFYFDFELRR